MKGEQNGLQLTYLYKPAGCSYVLNYKWAACGSGVCGDPRSATSMHLFMDGGIPLCILVLAAVNCLTAINAKGKQFLSHALLSLLLDDMLSRLTFTLYT